MTDISMRNYDNRYNGMDGGGSWAVGGMTLVGIGVGFAFLQFSPLLFVASIMVGIGSGLVMAATLSSLKA